jgi:O-antigen/teichoic acid export membrane protein
MLARAVTLNVLGQVGGLLVGFATSVLLARWLGPSDRGLLALTASASRFTIAIAGIGLPFAVAYHAARRDASPGALLGTCIAFAAVLGVLVTGAAWLFHDEIARALGRGQGGLLWVAAAALVPLVLVDWTTNSQLTGRLRFGLFNALGVASKVATLVVAGLLVGVLGLGVGGGLAATGAASVVMIGGSLPFLLALERPRIDLRLLRSLLRYGRRVQVGSLFQLLNYRLDVIILQAFVPLGPVGVYVMAQVLAELVIVLAQGFQTGVLPLVAREDGDRSRLATTAASLRHHGILAAAALVANVLFGTLVILFALGPGFHSALVPFLILLPGIWFLGTGTVVNGDLRGRDRPGLASLLTGAAVVVTVVLDVALIPPFGIRGAAVASVCAYTVFGILSVIALARVVGEPPLRLLLPTRVELDLYRTALSRLRRVEVRSRPELEVERPPELESTP